MPSIRIRRDTYSSLDENPRTPLVSSRSLTNIFNPTAPTTPAPPPRETVSSRPRPSLSVIKSGEEVPQFRPRSNTLGRVQSHVLGDSFRNSRTSLHGHDIESIGAATPATVSHHSLQSPQVDGVSYQERSGRLPNATYGRDWDSHHHDDVVEYLDAIDPQVSVVSALTNAANSILIPSSPLLFRKPVIALPIRPQEQGDVASALEDVLDRHVDDVIKRPSKTRRTFLGIWDFLKTPMGIITGIYGFLVVFWGAALVLFLLRWIKFSSDDLRGFWIETASQIENGLFTATSIGLIPFRAFDTYRICKIWHYKRKTIRLRKSAGLPQLIDPDDLPDPHYDDNFVRVLSDKEQKDLHRQQLKFQYRQTWYRPHGSETHRAFSINTALAICLFNDGNSIFQTMLCGVLWGLDRFERPAWTTGTLIPVTFLCGICAGVLIWRGGEKTKRVEEVRQKLLAVLAEIPTRSDMLSASLSRRNQLPHAISRNALTDIPEKEATDFTSEKVTTHDGSLRMTTPK